ncbi:MAG: MFS transporter [Corynebacterium sp.]|nr:MFS transporter [Corynebacterium sp.]
MLFNVGFYLVVPFLATYMTENLAATGAMVGLVLGLRTFSQQGLFFLGGGLADRFGVKPILLIGIAIRVAGFIAAGVATSTFQLMGAVVLIGFAAALFSPAAEASFAVSGLEVERQGIMKRSELFAMDAYFSRIGSLLGPLLGAALIGAGFPLTCFIAAGIFTFLFFSHLCIVPAVQTQSSASVLQGFRHVLSNKAFLLFALGYSTYLVSYNQQYLSLPVELERSTGTQDALGWMFVFSSVLVLSLQMPLTRIAQRMAPTRAIFIGFALMSVSFAIVMLASPLPPLPGFWALTPAILMLVCMHVGQMLAVPISRDLVGILAGEQNVGSYYGFLNSFGGLAVLLSSLTIGWMLDYSYEPQPAAALPWLALTVLMAASAMMLPRVARDHRRRPTNESLLT